MDRFEYRPAVNQSRDSHSMRLTIGILESLNDEVRMRKKGWYHLTAAFPCHYTDLAFFYIP